MIILVSTYVQHGTFSFSGFYDIITIQNKIIKVYYVCMPDGTSWISNNSFWYLINIRRATDEKWHDRCWQTNRIIYTDQMIITIYVHVFDTHNNTRCSFSSVIEKSSFHSCVSTQIFLFLFFFSYFSFVLLLLLPYHSWKCFMRV